MPSPDWAGQIRRLSGTENKYGKAADNKYQDSVRSFSIKYKRGV
jgi:hypothetical protein